MKLGLPNLLTLLRVVLIPVLVLIFILPFRWAYPATAVIFVAAAVTDWLDGFMARRLDQGSRLGAFLDPVADKLLVATALVLIVMASPRVWIAIPALIIIGREIAISALREWMAEVGDTGVLAVSWAGKVKTAAQMAAIALLLYGHALAGIPLYLIGLALLYIAATLTVFSMCLYLRSAWPRLRTGGHHEEPGEL